MQPILAIGELSPKAHDLSATCLEQAPSSSVCSFLFLASTCWAFRIRFRGHLLQEVLLSGVFSLCPHGRLPFPLQPHVPELSVYQLRLGLDGVPTFRPQLLAEIPAYPKCVILVW